MSRRASRRTQLLLPGLVAAQAAVLDSHIRAMPAVGANSYRVCRKYTRYMTRVALGRATLEQWRYCGGTCAAHVALVGGPSDTVQGEHTYRTRPVLTPTPLLPRTQRVYGLCRRSVTMPRDTNACATFKTSSCFCRSSRYFIFSTYLATAAFVLFGLIYHAVVRTGYC